MNTAPAMLQATNANFTYSAEQLFSMPNPTSLPTLKAQGKLLVFHGTADPIFSANRTRGWYKALLAADASAPNYARLFLVPGMNHGGGGLATDKFDAMTPLIQWVENAVAPDAIVATTSPTNTDLPSTWSPTRSRPLCAFPKIAKLNLGATDLEAASSFSCL
jgi:fermentation-respiration switch protein FrsA (DUF1100 family)